MRWCYAILAAVCLAGGCRKEAQPPTLTPQPASQSAAPAPPATQAQAPPLRTLLDLIRREHPAYAATQPLENSLTLDQAGHFILSDPVYLDQQRYDLWITRADSQETRQVLATAADKPLDRWEILSTDPPPHVHFLREQVVFVLWVYDSGLGRPVIFCQDGAAHPYALDADTRLALPEGRHFDWGRARVWNNKVLVPTAQGVSVLTVADGKIAEAASPPLGANAQVVMDWRGVLAWGDGPGSSVARFVDGQWQKLGPDDQWPTGIIYLMPLVDGTVLQIVRAGGENVTLRMVVLDPAPIDDKAVTDLVAQLSDDDPQKRQDAFEQLGQYGNSVWPILVRELDNQPTAAVRVRLKRLLAARIEPTIGPMKLVDGTLQLVQRLSDTGAVFYSTGGVRVLRESDEESTISPAWICVRPGTIPQLLPEGIVVDRNPQNLNLDVWGSEMIVTDDVLGPLRVMGPELVPLVRTSERGFGRLVGIDHDGRWVLANPRTGQTLILDPWLTDVQPRLPVWVIPVKDGSTGWDATGWPVMQSGGAFALRQTDWTFVDPKKEKIWTKEQAPATTPTTDPDLGTAILVDPQQTRYYGGQSEIVMVKADGSRVTWALPGTAQGVGKVRLVREPHGDLFLFNTPGRVVRLRVPGGGGEPLAVDGIFSHGIPNAELRRAWIDPAGRLCMVYEENGLAVGFPQGYIPRAIAEKIPTAELDAMRPEQ